jgi:CRP-like cAMP-binding protein
METDRKFLINFIRQTIPISHNVAENIAGNFQRTTLKKNDFLLQQGRVCNKYVFLENGFMRAYTFDTDANKVTTNFYEEGSVVFEVASYFKRTPSQENIQALTECTGWQGNYDKFQVLFHTIPEFREFGRSILVNGVEIKTGDIATCTTKIHCFLLRYYGYLSQQDQKRIF